jgi:DNA-binding transcriptional regulator YdaS (Cro superfamily)
MTDAVTEAMAALDEAIQVCGNTLEAFASAISTPELPVSQSKVSMWRSRKSVPAEYVPAIFRETKKRGKPIAPERFRPNIDWAVLREQACPDPANDAERSAACGERRRKPGRRRDGPTEHGDRGR